MSRYVCNAQHGRSRWAYEPGKRDIHPNPPSRRSTHSKPYAGRLTQYDVAIVLRTIFADHPCSTIFLFARTRTSSPRRDGLHLNSGVAIEDFAGFVAAAFSCPNFEATPDPVHTRLERTTTGTWTARSPAPSWFSSETPSPSDYQLRSCLSPPLDPANCPPCTRSATGSADPSTSFRTPSACFLFYFLLQRDDKC